MHDNFERARRRGRRGDYVAVVIDKTVLHPSALEVAARGAAQRSPRDIVTWQNEGYDPLDEARDPRPGRFRPARPCVAPALYDPRAELAARFANSERRGVDPVHYVARQDRLRRLLARAARAHPRADGTRVPSARARLHVDGARVRAGRGRARRRPAAARLLQLERAPTAGARASTRRTRGASSRPPTRRSSMRCRSRALHVACTTSWPTTSSPRPRAARPARRRRSTCRTSCGAPARTWHGVGLDEARRSARRSTRSSRRPSQRHGVTPGPRARRRRRAPRDRRAAAGSRAAARRLAGQRQPAATFAVAARRRPRGRPPLRGGSALVKAVILAGGRGSRLSEETVRHARSRWSRSAGGRSSGTS